MGERRTKKSATKGQEPKQRGMVGDSGLGEITWVPQKPPEQPKNLTLDEIKDLIRFAREELIFRLNLGNLSVEFSQLAFVNKGQIAQPKANEPANKQEAEKQKQQELEETRYYSAE